MRRSHLPWRRMTFELGLCALLAAGAAWAGPPFQTDDPEPVPWHHWEVYLAAMSARDPAGISGTLPHLEVNNGVGPNMMVHLIAPYSFQQATGGNTVRGFGDTELGVKYRFQQEGPSRPMLGVFPLLEVPTGNAASGLGSGHVQGFLPLWAQKSWGAWTDYGGGGYWINPGAQNRNYWFIGNTVQRDINAHLTLGGEYFYTSASTQGGRDGTVVNVGGQYNFSETHHLLFSAGHSLTGAARTITYLAYLRTFGPAERENRP